MSIIRGPRPETNFYVLNKDISEDRRLSWAARGLLVYLLGKPDHWQVSVKALVNATSDSAKATKRDGVYALLRELEAAGYLTKDQGRSGGGKFGEQCYIVSEDPRSPSNQPSWQPYPDQPYTDNPTPHPAQPCTAQPYTANPTQVSIERAVSTDVVIEIASPTAPPNECGASTVQPVPIKPKPRPREASQGTRLPTDWMLTQELGEWALSEGLTRDRIRQEADRFRDYWIAKPGSAGRKTDWPATWRNWVRRASETKTGGDNGKAERISNFERVARDAERHLEELDRLDRIDAEMEQRNRAIGNGAVSPDCIAVSSQGG